MSEKLHITETPDTSHIKNLDVTHETSDVQVGSIAKFVLGLSILTVGTFIVLWLMFHFLARSETRLEQQHPRPTMAQTGNDRLPPEPRLQSAPGFSESLERNKPKTEKEEADADKDKPKDPLWEIKALREEWKKTLEHGPVDQNGTHYGMPIEKAKEEVLKQLPVRGQAPADRKQ